MRLPVAAPRQLPRKLTSPKSNPALFRRREKIGGASMLAALSYWRSFHVGGASLLSACLAGMSRANCFIWRRAFPRRSSFFCGSLRFLASFECATRFLKYCACPPMPLRFRFRGGSLSALKNFAARAEKNKRRAEKKRRARQKNLSAAKTAYCFRRDWIALPDMRRPTANAAARPPKIAAASPGSGI